MEIHEIRLLIDRWDKLFDKAYAVNQVNKEVSNTEIFFKEKVLGAKNFPYANKVMDEIEEEDTKFKKECESRKLEEATNKVKKKIDEALDETTWSMLSDAPLSQMGKQLYRQYRQYVRDIPDLWRRRQITKLEVMSFDKWREDPPKYKVENKVIL